MDSKIRKRKFNKQSHKEHSNSKSPFSRYSLQPAMIFKISISTFFLVLLAAYLVKFYLAYSSDYTFVPFDGNATFPIDVLLGDQYWSSLLSGHYFGLRAAAPLSPIVSLMWFRNKVENNGLPIRHWCNRDDNLEKFIWNYNDLEFGDQFIHDRNLHINTSFIRVRPNAIISRVNLEDTTKLGQLNSIILYAAAENSQDTIEALNLDTFSENSVFTIRAQSKTSGNFTLNLKLIQGKALARSYLNANSSLDQLKETVLKNLYIYKDAQSSKSIFMIANSNPEVSQHRNNFIAYQIVFQNSIQIEAEMLFDHAHIEEDFNYQHELTERKARFDRNFEEKFPLSKKNLSDEMISFARAVLSNMMGGISYFYGSSLVTSPQSTTAKTYGPVQLLTAVPSRSFFPRGFLWDEGFHQLLISSWDPQLSKTIIKSWFSLMNKNGWIPREVILGDEARSRVPSEFLVQHSTNANPPTFFLALENLLDNQQAEVEWLREIYPRVERWYNWFNTSQTGNFPGTFRWRGRNATTNLELNPKTLTSGLDDFPRATHPTDEEVHVDLRCWMALASRVMSKIAKVLGNDDLSYERFYRVLQDNQQLEHWHWSSQHNMFCDKGLNSDDVQLVTVIRDQQEYVERRVNRAPKYECIAHFGYISLFPFIMTLLEPTNSKLEIILKDIENPNLLWSPYGLRSLSKSSFYYLKFNTRHDGPYWRGTVWINMNFLVLKALNHYATTEGPYQAQMQGVYMRLRENLMANIYAEYVRSGYLWEQYSDKDGKGIGTYPFTGWTALIVRIMGERY